MATDVRQQPGPAGAPQAYWRSFPQFEALLASGSPDLLGRIETTCRQLDTLARSGSAQEQQRARSAMAAYTQALELYRRLAEIRNQMAEKERNATAAASDNKA